MQRPQAGHPKPARHTGQLGRDPILCGGKSVTSFALTEHIRTQLSHLSHLSGLGLHFALDTFNQSSSHPKSCQPLGTEDAFWYQVQGSVFRGAGWISGWDLVKTTLRLQWCVMASGVLKLLWGQKSHSGIWWHQVGTNKSQNKPTNHYTPTWYWGTQEAKAEVEGPVSWPLVVCPWTMHFMFWIGSAMRN